MIFSIVQSLTLPVLIDHLGVIGLSTGLKIQATGRYQVEIIADVLPTDPKDIKYTSHWAVRTFNGLPG